MGSLDRIFFSQTTTTDGFIYSSLVDLFYLLQFRLSSYFERLLDMDCASIHFRHDVVSMITSRGGRITRHRRAAVSANPTEHLHDKGLVPPSQVFTINFRFPPAPYSTPLLRPAVPCLNFVPRKLHLWVVGLSRSSRSYGNLSEIASRFGEVLCLVSFAIFGRFLRFGRKQFSRENVTKMTEL